MFTKLTALTALVLTAIVVPGMAGAGGGQATMQRIAITSQGAAFETFVVTPLAPGAVVRDAAGAWSLSSATTTLA